ncbi:Putative disease resistance protein RGA4 [Glycine soja]|uniref:Putative disease resistance protein RGA4 n=1 Tax=Glycine soja TaxID=3848 RepID=A0A0B2SP54_GLYSO|nr:Putative disease resistance protein RGA4 [Glycine soja]
MSVRHLEICACLTKDLYDWVEAAYSYLAMVNYPYPAEFMMTLPEHPIRESYNMVEFVLETLLGNLNSLVQKELLLFLGFDQNLEKLSSLLTTIKATLEDAEEKQFSNRAIKDWLEKLKHAAHILDEIIDKCSYEGLGLEYQGVKCGPSDKILKLDRCSRLKMLPKSLICLKALRQLSFSDCQELSSLPPQIGMLTSLRILTKFFVGKERGFCLEELGPMKLKGNLDIKHLGNVKSLMDAKEANMSKYLYEESCDGEIVFRALEDLTIRHHPNFKRLSREYGENMFPCLSNLEITECAQFLGEEVLLKGLDSLTRGGRFASFTRYDFPQGVKIKGSSKARILA